MRAKLETLLDQLIEKHVPIAFLDYDLVIQLKELLLRKEHFGRKEILILAYLLGATAEEGNALLLLLGHPPLYVKRREDAIWKYAFNHRMDSVTIINEIFLQNVDESANER